ncbi:MAG: 2-methoxy-6-polyprenyl-1,4-benzoquinol methylase, mitochondrial [Chlamydiales bacterium]|nr:2-methoxy-6-polyprenyl-1,4-benzoquinol methylase, mitochondrial [Chlamydiales bacterium]MCH9635070.1 2-methoxy-6-polyprenyl-1,4-benzoquinol methylase, mitochondrial [Chlamydiales bacterium]
MEIDLLENYPKAKRNVKERGATKTEEDRAIARQFGKEFFDGERKTGYGGFSYNSRFWQPVVPTFQKHYGLTSESSILDVGCAKGFMLHDFCEKIPGIKVRGVDVSSYAIENAMNEVKSDVSVADARELPFEDNSFDVVISINTIHNLEQEDLIQALREIERISKKGSFITVDAYRNEDEKELMYAWNLTAKTILSVVEWKELFARAGYTGDYYWFIP